MGIKRICIIVGICCIALLVVEFWNLNAGVNRNLNSNFRTLQDSFVEMSSCLDTEKLLLNEEAQRNNIEEVVIIAFSSVREINFVAENSGIYHAYYMPELETFLLHLIAKSEMELDESISVQIHSISKKLSYVDLDVDVYRYNLMIDSKGLKKKVSEIELELKD